ncbi:MAG: hypothetical protein KAV98_05740 [Dehalococcoidia bacterium]|nr:hypothetical protein [Dehalococcoidia bacterium]
MQDIIKPDDARALLQSTQQLRTHWSSVITTHIGYAIMINVAIWSYFLKSYIDSLAVPSKAQPLYIVLAAAISAITLGVWRLYTHNIDNHIAGLYPDFLLYEGILSVPSDHGTSGYLIRAVPKVDLIFLDNDLTTEQKLEGISTLVKSKRIGRRGHLAIDLFTLVALLGMFIASLSLRSELQSLLAIPCFIGILVGLLFILFGLFSYQRNPTKRFIEEILSELKGNGGSGA